MSPVEKDFYDYYFKYYNSFGLNAALYAEGRLLEAQRELKLVNRLNGLLAQRPRKILILGCGTGGLCRAFRDYYQSEDLEVVAIDLDEEAIRLAFQYHGLQDCKGVFLKVGDARHLNEKEQYFDLVVSVSVLEHIPGWVRVLDEIKRVIKPNATLFLNVPNYQFPREPHYKILAPTPLGKYLTGMWLRFLGRPIKPVDDLNFFTKKEVQLELAKRFNVLVDLSDVMPRSTRDSWRGASALSNLAYILCERFGIRSTSEFLCSNTVAPSVDTNTHYLG
ncbi:MAG: class I SAM-dependent methyltransferase [Pseudomonadota bacterium]|nr:class I SAM-dependent methyltransferase [Pseudomonadota bacterium]